MALGRRMDRCRLKGGQGGRLRQARWRGSVSIGSNTRMEQLCVLLDDGVEKSCWPPPARRVRSCYNFSFTAKHIQRKQMLADVAIARRAARERAAMDSLVSGTQARAHQRRLGVLLDCVHALMALDASSTAPDANRCAEDGWRLVQILRAAWDEIERASISAWPGTIDLALRRAAIALREIYWGADAQQVYPGGIVPLLAKTIADLHRAGVHDEDLERYLRARTCAGSNAQALGHTETLDRGACNARTSRIDAHVQDHHQLRLGRRCASLAA